MNRLAAIALLLLSACGSVTPPEDDVNPPPPCEAARTDDFAMGIMVFDNPRWFKAFDDGCNQVEMETGLQGGWHIEPAIQAPRTATIQDLGGRILWSVKDETGDEVARAEFELFRSFWQTLEGGDAYWGDFVIFERNPEALVGSQLTIECTLEFDEQSSLSDLTLVETVDFVDLKENTEF